MTNKERIISSPGNNFLLGITEDVPQERWRTSLNIILDVIEKHGRLPLK
jgi:hypothetical protein